VLRCRRTHARRQARAGVEVEQDRNILDFDGAADRAAKSSP
jgi:hypothetical protein